ncbi:hypothetical protein [Streptomyces sp. NPDC059708]|uniref:hypothetical protein n=1 Tax=Streptomyces sp. NPDC059708 TaxID=3346916 RepID=UPI0036BBDDF4
MNGGQDAAAVVVKSWDDRPVTFKVLGPFSTREGAEQARGQLDSFAATLAVFTEQITSARE